MVLQLVILIVSCASLRLTSSFVQVTHPTLVKYQHDLLRAIGDVEWVDGRSQYCLDENERPVDVPSNRNLLYVQSNSTVSSNVKKRVNLQTPHSGRKFRPTHPKTLSRLHSFFNNNRRFTEGWYYRLTLPQYNESFVFIFSIEDAGRYVRDKNSNSLDVHYNRSKLSRIRRSFRGRKVKSPLTLACMQLLGPQDTYLVQSDEDDTKFWGWKHAQGLGCTFEWNRANHTNVSAMLPEEWSEEVKSGFQVMPFHFQGRLDGHDGTMGGVKANQGIPGKAEFDFKIRPVAGWGNYPSLSSVDTWSSNNDVDSEESQRDERQFSTAGWLANYPVFEPHWQITMANDRASGTLNWNGTMYEFQDAPFYGEKNWGKYMILVVCYFDPLFSQICLTDINSGGAFPTKWYWAQCNSFDNHPDLAFTAGGGIRQLPFSFLPGKKTETLGLIGIHHNGTFYEIVPWTGQMNWKVWSWGRWEFHGRCTNKNGKQFEAEVVAFTNEPGVLLRAPTKDEGMVSFENGMLLIR